MLRTNCSVRERPPFLARREGIVFAISGRCQVSGQAREEGSARRRPRAGEDGRTQRAHRPNYPAPNEEVWMVTGCVLLRCPFVRYTLAVLAAPVADSGRGRELVRRPNSATFSRVAVQTEIVAELYI
jgi:hypothetical protein